jgi:hypothetical protein
MRAIRVSIPLLIFFPTVLFTGCIRSELSNSECDIEQCWLHMTEPETVFFHAYDTLGGVPLSTGQPEVRVIPSAADSIVFTTRWNAQVTAPIPLYIKATPGATVYHVQDGREVPFQNGTPVDFTATSVGQHTVQTFIVRSEDGQWYRRYRIFLQVPPMPSYPPDGFQFRFEDYALEPSEGKYYVWQESNPFASDVTWANGNPGFRLSVSSAQPEDYPTVPLAHGGIDDGPCLRLRTCDTGGFGRMVNMRLAAGNHFIGTFDVANALRDALAATRFGVPFAHKPQLVRGFYRYTPGNTVQDRSGKPIDGATDQCDIYAVFFRNIDADGHQVQLDGSNVTTSPHIVAIARIDPATIRIGDPEWQPFSIPFDYLQQVSDEDIRQKRCSMTIVFSSSVDGANFIGAIGSTLWIDNVTLDCEY